MNVAYAAVFLILTFAFPIIFIVYQMHFKEISEEKYSVDKDKNGLNQPIIQADIA